MRVNLIPHSCKSFVYHEAVNCELIYVLMFFPGLEDLYISDCIFFFILFVYKPISFLGYIRAKEVT